MSRSFMLLNPEVRIEASASPTYHDHLSHAAAVVAHGATHAVVVDHRLPADALSCSEAQAHGNTCGAARVIPTAAAALAVVANIPELGGRAPLVVTPALLARVLTGNVSRWNDPAIAAINNASAALLPDAPIAVVVAPTHESSVRPVVLELLRARVGEAAELANPPRDPSLQLARRLLLDQAIDVASLFAAAETSDSVSTDQDVAFRVEGTPHSLGVVPFGVVQALDIDGRVLRMVAGDAATSVSLSRTTFYNARDTAVRDREWEGFESPPRIRLAVTDTEHWPLVHFVSTVLDGGAPALAVAHAAAAGVDLCAALRAAGSFVRWVIGAQAAQTRAEAFGLAQLPLLVAESASQALDSATCGGAELLDTGKTIVKASGASFPANLYLELAFMYQFEQPAVQIQYDSIGSGGGQRDIKAKRVHWAGSDAVLSQADQIAYPDLVLFPVVAGAVVISYNLPSVSRTAEPLVLDGPTIAAIYLGHVVHWRHPAIVALNPHLAASLPDANITVVVRSDRSGTTEVLTNALVSFSPVWRDTVGTSQQPNPWPASRATTVLAGNGNKGVTSLVETTPNSLGYVVLDYALSARLRFASVRNRAGRDVRASLRSIQAAIADFQAEPSPVHSIADGPGLESYPISGYTYIIVPRTESPDCVAGAAMLRFFRWVLESEQVAATAERMGFAVLPAERRITALAIMESLTCDGVLLVGTCGAGRVYDPVRRECADCPPGTVAANGAPACSYCLPGSAAPSAGLAECVTCGRSSYAPDVGMDECLPCPSLSATDLPGATRLEQCTCERGTYADRSNASLRCADCMAGATCAGGSALPLPLPGFWSSSVAPTVVLRCPAPDTCPGGAPDACSLGHQGVICAECVSGWYRVDSRCDVCPDTFIIRILVALAMAAFSLLGPYFVAKHRLLSVGMTTSFMQTTTVLRLINLGWPASISFFFSLLSPVNWFIQFVSPECSLDMDYFGRWLFRVCVPFLVIIAFALFTLAVMALRACHRCCSKSAAAPGPLNPHSHLRRTPPSSTPTPSDIEVVPMLALASRGAGNQSQALTTPAPETDPQGRGDSATGPGPAAQQHLLGRRLQTVSQAEREPGTQLTRRPSQRHGGPHEQGRPYVSGGSSVAKQFAHKVSRAEVFSLVSSGSNAYAAAIIQLYVFLSQAAIEYFACSQASDGQWRLDAQPSVICYEGKWTTFLPVAVLASIIHVVAVPVALAWVVRRSRHERTSVLFRASFGFVYQRYTAQYYWWELVVFGRKMLLLFAVLLLGSTRPVSACVAVLVVLVGNLLAQQACRPFCSPKANFVEPLLLVADCGLAACGLLFYTGGSEISPAQLLVIIWLIAAFALAVVLWLNWVEILGNVCGKRIRVRCTRRKRAAPTIAAGHGPGDPGLVPGGSDTVPTGSHGAHAARHPIASPRGSRHPPLQRAMTVLRDLASSVSLDVGVQAVDVQAARQLGTSMLFNNVDDLLDEDVERVSHADTLSTLSRRDSGDAGDELEEGHGAGGDDTGHGDSPRLSARGDGESRARPAREAGEQWATRVQPIEQRLGWEADDASASSVQRSVSTHRRFTHSSRRALRLRGPPTRD